MKFDLYLRLKLLHSAESEWEAGVCSRLDAVPPPSSLQLERGVPRPLTKVPSRPARKLSPPLLLHNLWPMDGSTIKKSKAIFPADFKLLPMPSLQTKSTIAWVTLSVLCWLLPCDWMIKSYKTKKQRSHYISLQLASLIHTQPLYPKPKKTLEAFENPIELGTHTHTHKGR